MLKRAMIRRDIAIVCKENSIAISIEVVGEKRSDDTDGAANDIEVIDGNGRRIVDDYRDGYGVGTVASSRASPINKAVSASERGFGTYVYIPSGEMPLKMP
ncbi:MAG: hypothetical protein ABIP75_07255 [Pyrinomonadaceae bacterium]